MKISLKQSYQIGQRLANLIKLEQLIKETAGMNPQQFEAYCDNNGIQTEWLEVCVSDFNDGFYNVTLPDYNDANVFASDGSAVEINS